MPFVPKKTKGKKQCGYKTIYLSQELSDKVTSIANKYETSFNNVIVSMIEKCLEERE